MWPFGGRCKLGLTNMVLALVTLQFEVSECMGLSLDLRLLYMPCSPSPSDAVLAIVMASLHAACANVHCLYLIFLSKIMHYPVKSCTIWVSSCTALDSACRRMES